MLLAAAIVTFRVAVLRLRMDQLDQWINGPRNQGIHGSEAEWLSILLRKNSARHIEAAAVVLVGPLQVSDAE